MAKLCSIHPFKCPCATSAAVASNEGPRPDPPTETFAVLGRAHVSCTLPVRRRRLIEEKVSPWISIVFLSCT